jgi:hypothetical protein
MLEERNISYVAAFRMTGSGRFNGKKRRAAKINLLSYQIVLSRLASSSTMTLS